MVTDPDAEAALAADLHSARVGADNWVMANGGLDREGGSAEHRAAVRQANYHLPPRNTLLRKMVVHRKHRVVVADDLLVDASEEMNLFALFPH